MVTENTYDTSSGLLLYTDVAVNGTKQRVSKVTYDDLGRITSVVRGNGTNSGGTVSYGYNLHGQTTSITGPGFSQRLHYTDGPGKPLYNGSVSAMFWTMGTDATRRGYKYTYNGYNWLTLAEYGEGDNLTDHRNRYTENSLEFMRNGGIRRLQRHGLKADGNYGKIDNLHIYYDGKRITGVLEDADAVTQPGSMDYPGKKREMAFEYNDWGAHIKDESRGITQIEYDYTGNPTCVYFSDGSYSYNVYSISGVKLRTHHYTKPKTTILTPVGQSDDAEAESQVLTPMDGHEYIEYHGPVIYRNGKIDMVQFPGGYATISGTAVTFHYYTQDYLGNNRAVINGSTGEIEQTTAYYPYGAVIADLGTGNYGQPFKFIGKELISANGLNEYDFGARRQYPAIPQFTSIDPLCEKYYHLSPYLYCGNDPINRFDQNGDSIAVLNLGGLIGHSAMLIQQKDGNWHYYSKNGDNIYRETNGSFGGKGYHDLGEKSFGSPMQFLESDYNRSGEDSEKDNNDVSGYDFKESLILPTTPEQDKTAAEAFVSEASKEYDLFDSNCAQTVHSALKSIGINFEKNYNAEDSQGMGTMVIVTKPIFPESLFNEIRKRFPNAVHIKK
ncbi:MAG: hypothetical protein NC095_09890 [Muribaculum sp.]|nr:hypothetical protein [Muribaculum sp.]